MAAGDFDKDGWQDLAITTATISTDGVISGAVTVLLNNQSGGFTLPGITVPVGNNPSSVAVGDFDGDGYPDLAITNRDSNSVTVLLNRTSTTGGFVEAPGSPFTVGNSPSSVAVGDFNGDNYLDLAIANELDNTVTVLRNDGTGRFTAFPASPFTVGYAPAFVVVADFNGDGNLDFATANLSGNNVTVLLGNGTGGFTPTPASPAVQGLAPVSMAVGDFNGDYIPDLAISDSKSGNVTILLGNGTGGFKTGPGSPYAVGASPVSLAVGDFNSDGAPDLVIVNSGDDNVTLLLNAITITPVMVPAASYSATAPVAPGSIVSVFGTDSAVNQPLVATPPAACLGNIGVTLTDFSGVKTPLQLLYVGQTQKYAGPIQINAQIPQTVATGAASFTVSIFAPPSPPTSTPCSSPRTGIAQKGSITVAAVAPALFSENETGKGVAAAIVADLIAGKSTNAFVCPTPTTCVPSPIPDIGAGGSILMLYGTGIQNRAKLSDVTVTVGSQTLPALYAGPAPNDPGVDQVNVALPSSLAGSGTVYVTVSVAGTTSNPVTLYIQ
ncbi:MAG: FG-GAP-like repeat-containing protein [Bryobacteraceae bacterium]